MKKLTALFLTLSIALSLSACGAAGDSPANATEPAAETVQTYTYTPRFVELGGMENYLTPRCFTDEGLYATAAVMVSNNIPAGVTPEYETQYYQYEQRLYFIALDGTVRRLRSYAPLIIDEDTSGVMYYTQSNNIASMLIGDSGALTVLEAVDEGWYEKIVNAAGKERTGDYIARQRWFIRTLDNSGAELSRCEIKLERGEWLDGYKAVADGSGNIVVIDRKGIRGVDSAGETLWKISSDEAVGEVLKPAGGSVCVLSWGDCWSVKSVDITSGTLSAAVKLPHNVYAVSAGTGRELLYNDGTELCAFNVDTGESRDVLSWLDCDINPETVSKLTALENGDLAGIVTEYDEQSAGYVTELFVLERATEHETGADSLSFGTAALNSELSGLIIAHNRSGGGKRIQIMDYSKYENPAEKLTEDIRSGNGPDIIDLTGLNVTALAAEGLLENLYPYIDADGELDRADYFENLLSSCEYDGKLISSCPGFYIRTLIGAQSVVGAGTEWTLADFAAAAEKLDADSSIMDYYTTRGEVLAELLALCRDELINDAQGSCNFQTPLFADILRFASLFPEKYDWSGFTGDADDSTYFRLKTQRQMLSGVNIYAPEDIFACDANFEGDAAFIGYPVAEGSGSALMRQWGLAISAKSGYKDEAWEFLRPFFTEDYQKDFWGIPAMKALFEQELEAAMAVSYYTDGAGSAILDENGQPIAMSKADFGDKDREGDSAESFYVVTEEQAQRLRQLISAAVRAPETDGGAFQAGARQDHGLFCRYSQRGGGRRRCAGRGN